MDHARRGYILIAVMLALTICVTLSGAFALSSHRGIVQARVGVESAQAQYLARGACIHAVRDLSVALHRRGMVARGAVEGATTGDLSLVAPSQASTRIQGLPEFPAEMAGAGGLLGAIAEAMGRVRERQSAAGVNPDADSPAGPAPAPAPGSDDAERRARNGGRGADAPPPPVRMGMMTVNIDGERIEARIESETGKINVNTARRDTLVALMIALGENESDARSIVNAIEDMMLRKALAPGEVMRATPARVGEEPLRGVPLERVEELLGTPGISASLYVRLLSCLTVGYGSTVDPNYAPRPVLMALGLRDPRALDRIEQMQANGEGLSRERVRFLIGGAAFRALDEHLADGLSPIYTVRTHAVVGESVGRHLIRIGVGENGVPRVLESRDGWI